MGNRLEFVTFHQSFTYEDFVQGFRPKVIDGQMVFEKSDGVFYRIAQRARQEWEAQKSINSGGLSEVEVQFLKQESQQPVAPYNVPFQQVLDELRAPLSKPDATIEMDMKKPGSKFTILSVDSKELHFRRGSIDDKVSLAWLKKHYEYKGDRGKISGPQNYCFYIVDKLRELAQNFSDKHLVGPHAVTAVPVAATIPALASGSTLPSPPVQNYVLIIDEINRANIARVFGELITLLEKDKRLGGSNTLPVTLPSGEQGFTVPANLYLIGTMNTADRSLALLDIALRRRFEFRPLYPRYDVFGKMKDDRKNTLQKLNAEIVLQKSRDFQIGHAYFLDPEESLDAIFNGKVIPLLYEYFLNDEPKVQALLRTAGVTTHVDQSVGLRYGPAGPVTH